MKKDGAFRALLDFARENPDCLNNQGDEMSEVIIKALADGGMHPRQLWHGLSWRLCEAHRFRVRPQR